MEFNKLDQDSPETPETRRNPAKKSDLIRQTKSAAVSVNTPKDIRYSGIKLDSSMEQEAKKIVSLLSGEIGDKVKRVFITKKTIQPGVPDSGGAAIIFRIEFLESPTFVGAVLRDPSDMPPSGGMDIKRAADKVKGVDLIKRPVSEAMRGTPSIKTIFVTADGKIEQLLNNDKVSFETKDIIKKFLISLSKYMDAGTPEKLRTKGYSQDNKNRQGGQQDAQQEDFKKRISEIAAKIAGVNEKYDGSKINLPDSYKARVNAAVADTKDMALFVLDIMKEIVEDESSMKDIENRSGWNNISALLKRAAGMSADKDAEETPDVSSDDQKKLDLPDLKESYDRIKKK